MTQITALSRDEQEFSRRVVIAGIALVVMFYLGWRISDAQHVAVTVSHAASADRL